jgi:WD40 repeat protein
LAYSSDGQRLAAAGSWDTINWWDTRTGRAFVPLASSTKKNRQPEVYTVVFSADGLRLISAGSDGAVRIWDVRTGQELLTLREFGKDKFGKEDKPVYGVAFSSDGHRLAANSDNTIKIWEPTRSR